MADPTVRLFRVSSNATIGDYGTAKVGIMGSVTGQPSYYDRRQRLHEAVILYELRITEAERRIENHQKLWPLAAVTSRQRRLHVELERNLLESLKLLHIRRGMALHELRFANTPRPTALYGSADGWSESPARDRQEHLSNIIAWLDALPITPISGVIVEQRDRANRELWQIQKRQLWSG